MWLRQRCCIPDQAKDVAALQLDRWTDEVDGVGARAGVVCNWKRRCWRRGGIRVTRRSNSGIIRTWIPASRSRSVPTLCALPAPAGAQTRRFTNRHATGSSTGRNAIDSRTGDPLRPSGQATDRTDIALARTARPLIGWPHSQGRPRGSQHRHDPLATETAFRNRRPRPDLESSIPGWQSASFLPSLLGCSSPTSRVALQIMLVSPSQATPAIAKAVSDRSLLQRCPASWLGASGSPARPASRPPGYRSAGPVRPFPPLPGPAPNAAGGQPRPAHPRIPSSSLHSPKGAHPVSAVP